MEKWYGSDFGTATWAAKVVFKCASPKIMGKNQNLSLITVVPNCFPISIYVYIFIHVCIYVYIYIVYIYNTYIYIDR